MDITDLLKRISAGDRQAFAGIVAHYQRPLFGFLGRMALGQGQAEEVAQETFLRAWQKLGEYRPERAGFSTWLFTIARNLALHELERAARRNELGGAGDLPEPACERPQPPEALALARQQRRLQGALRRLPLADRGALALAYNHELELAEVARIEGCSVAAIKTRLHRAKEKLRQLLLEDSDG
ncbi:RNA polymerase sigma factor [Janthinobacterium fluminis]|uniref:RNA polymerase sigma factor n=1 Tax=Janthinobacterium fluminis TaxID=2987524 RepID=A0ABT5K074_9BURK|nr:sigma-70 family RNA polymerase sigma factor [Janthinobacterium fluminis]MDC8758371.1 sigma-70 family RNA polymerase sigma factor [Janthinobacterium fluminis]